MWKSLSPDVRAFLVESELKGGDFIERQQHKQRQPQRSDSCTTTPTVMTPSSSVSFSEQSSLLGSSKESDDDNDDVDAGVVIHEKCPVSGADFVLTPLERAPKNVFAFHKIQTTEKSEVVKTSSATITTTTKVVSTSRGWRNIFSLPISYDVNMVAHGTLFDTVNSQLLDATGVHEEGSNTRFAVVDAEVDKLYGDKIREYFMAKGIELTICVINGGELDKRQKVSIFKQVFFVNHFPDVLRPSSCATFQLYVVQAVDTILDELCAYKLRRREPFLAIGGGCVLDIAGMAACLYRRGVPFVRIPTTLLAIVDASVGVKNGVDYCCGVTDETYKNRIGSFYAPSACLLDPGFISSQDARNISNGLGEVLKLALVRSSDLFELLEAHGKQLVETRFEDEKLKLSGVTSRIIDLSIKIMLEELGPNLWEAKLDRCVDYGEITLLYLNVVSIIDLPTILRPNFTLSILHRLPTDRPHILEAPGDGSWSRYHAWRSCQR